MADGITVRFGGFVALEAPASRVGPGEIVGLIGPNGAGKTTLFNVITGLVAEQQGTVALGERDLSAEPPHRIARAGLARTFQNLRLFSTLDGARERRAGRAQRPPLPARRGRRRSRRAAGRRRARPRSPSGAAATLDYGNQRRLELARAAALAPAYLLLDEPTSGMSDAESLAMVEHVRATAAARSAPACS